MSQSSRATARPQLEVLEDRTTPAVTANFNMGTLTIASDAADALTVTVTNGNVLVNGVDPGSGVLAASAVTSLVVNGGPGANAINLANVLPAAFTALTAINVTGGEGSDSLTINPAFGLTFAGNAGTDTLIATGTAADVIVDYAAGTLALAGRVVTNDAEAYDLRTTTNNLTFRLANGTTERLSDDAVAADAFSQLTRQGGNGQTTRFRHPTASLTFLGTAGNETLEVAGLDATAIPPAITYDGAGGTDIFRVLGERAGIRTTYSATGFTLFGLPAVNLPNVESIRDERETVARRFDFTNGTDRITIRDGVAENDGLTEILVNENGTTRSLIFRNPSTVLHINGLGGDDVINFLGVDGDDAPNRVMIDAGRGADAVNVTPSPTSLVFAKGGLPRSRELDRLVVSLAGTSLVREFGKPPSLGYETLGNRLVFLQYGRASTTRDPFAAA